MALYAIGDLHLSLGTNKPMDVFGGRWEGYMDKLRAGLAVIGPEDTTVLPGDLSWALGIEQAKREVEELEIKSSQPGFWDNPEESQKIVSRMGSLKGKVEAYGRMCTLCDDLLTICEMAIEEDDESMLEELETGFKELEETVAEQKLGTLLTGEYDSHNALVSFHAGAGGTEAQDWCAMLYRMYTRWAERHGFTYKIMDYQDGDTAGIKSADILIEGENAYGFLKGENGVHRLVRISPFDASGRRQTSFSAVEVVPDIPDTSADFEIKPDDYEMQVYRSSGAGGQHINKTSSAIRITHFPTGVVVSCQEERSQFANKDKAFKMLRSKLLALKIEEQMQKLAEIRGDVKEIGWGSQIRSYIFMPYTLVKDHRTGEETGKVDAVMDGEIDNFISAYLAWIHS